MRESDSLLALTPPMGWNSWNTFGGRINEAVIRETADAFVSEGLKDAGYEYVVIDDLWEADERVDGRLTWDPTIFPSGIPALADYIHSKGLKFGIYSCAGSHTCAGKPASYGYEEVDAQTFAEWGVDFLKYDFCYAPQASTARCSTSAWVRRFARPDGRSSSACASGAATSRGVGCPDGRAYVAYHGRHQRLVGLHRQDRLRAAGGPGSVRRLGPLE